VQGTHETLQEIGVRGGDRAQKPVPSTLHSLVSTEESWASWPTQGDEKRLLFSNYCPWKHCPPLCHLDRGSGVERSAVQRSFRGNVFRPVHTLLRQGNDSPPEKSRIDRERTWPKQRESDSDDKCKSDIDRLLAWLHRILRVQKNSEGAPCFRFRSCMKRFDQQVCSGPRKAFVVDVRVKFN
jgi:hypothetical protein